MAFKLLLVAGSVEIMRRCAQTENASETVVETSEAGSDTVSEEVALTVSEIEEPAELFFLQAGAFSRKLNAERFVRMNGADSTGYFVVQKNLGCGRQYWSVRKNGGREAN